MIRKFVLLILLTALLSFMIPAYANDNWTPVLTLKSGRNQIQDIMTDSLPIRSKVFKIVYCCELDPKFETGYFRIGCYRTFGDKSCFERIITPEDCNYYLSDSVIIYGWQYGFSDYKINVKSESMDWIVNVYEYSDYSQEPSWNLVTEYTPPINDSKKPCFDLETTYSVLPKDGILALSLEFVKIKCVEPSFSIYYTIDTNPGLDCSIDCFSGFIIHVKKGAVVTFHITSKSVELKLKLYDVKYNFT